MRWLGRQSTGVLLFYCWVHLIPNLFMFCVCVTSNAWIVLICLYTVPGPVLWNNFTSGRLIYISKCLSFDFLSKKTERAFACFPHFHVGLLRKRKKEHVGRWVDYPKLPCVMGMVALRWTGVLFRVYSTLTPSVSGIDTEYTVIVTRTVFLSVYLWR